MLFKSVLAVLGVLFVLSSSAAVGVGDEKRDRELKLALDELKNEVVLLERQVRSMQESMDRSGGQTSALILQISDNVSAIRQAQGRVAESAVNAIHEVTGIGERLSATNQRIDRLSEQLAQVKKLVEDLPKLPAFPEINPGNPDQLFAAAYGDYSRGNYDLSLSEFRQYVETYASSELADNAQYFIGEVFFAKGQFAEAVAEYDKVLTLFPKGDKVPAARLKKAMSLAKLGQTEAAQVEFQAIIKLFPRSPEANAARQYVASNR